MQYNDVTTNPIWLTAVILKNVFWLYLHDLLFDWREIEAQSRSRTGQMTKLAIFENSRWRTAAILKIVSSLYLSHGSYPIVIKFGMPLQILVLRTAMWQSIKILQIQNGGRPPYWKSSFGYICTIYCPMNAKSCRRSRITFRHRPHDKNTKFWKLKMADGRHFENGVIAICQPGIIQFQWNLVYHCSFGSKDGHVTKYQNIANSKWRTAAI